MKRNLLVTLADKNYIDQAKQLFSSAYWNGGWKGDYMLLSHEIPEKELKWFRDKGIVVYKCKPLIKEKVYGKWSSVVFNKFYLFSSFFKKWKKIIFLDSDIIIRYSINELLNVNKFGAVRGGNRFKTLIMSEKEMRIRKIDISILDEINNMMNINSFSFNSGVIVFDSSIIKRATQRELIKLYEQFNLVIYGDEPLINLYFNNICEELPKYYNTNPRNLFTYYGILPNEIDAIILHFSDNRPWEKRSYFFNEWNNNFLKYTDINVIKSHKVNDWGNNEIEYYENMISKNSEYRGRYILRRKIIKYKRKLIKNFGLVGVYTQINYPNFYSLIWRK